MGKPYSLDLRERLCAYVAKGNSARLAGRRFGVGAATAVRFAAGHRHHGAAVPKPQGRPAGQFGKLAPHRDFLRDIEQAEPDITLKELATALSETYGLDGQLSSLHRALARAGLTQDALMAPWVINGAMNGPAFDTYIETQLAPALDPGTVVILDNLSTHKSPRAPEALRKRGC